MSTEVKQNILSYACFVNAYEFEKWQQDNLNYKISQVTPMTSGFEFDIQEEKPHVASAKAVTGNIKTFVLYLKPIDEE